ncbi:hypothetical protein PCLA_06r0209 [Pseudomonas citronellolis]|nr:hypothetical protein PCLA_06r0209 [Pseudomonas citronellolis]
MEKAHILAPFSAAASPAGGTTADRIVPAGRMTDGPALCPFPGRRYTAGIVLS